MSDQGRLREVEETDLGAFYQQANDPESVRRSKFLPRDRETFMAITGSISAHCSSVMSV
jgi:hypothetical protein